METYRGVKFSCRRSAASFSFDERLGVLNHWAWLLGQLGLTPIHPSGAYGNLSCRFQTGFLVTRSGMQPQEELDPDDYCLVERYDQDTGILVFKGRNQPSSESLLHDLVYRNCPEAGAVLHGHSELLLRWAARLGLPVTSSVHAYGTVQLAEAALELIMAGNRVFLLKEHGFVAVGPSIAAAGRLTLRTYQALLERLADENQTDDV